MTKLNDIQLIVQTGAARREDGNLLPPPSSVAEAGDRLNVAVVSLQKFSLIAGRTAKDAKATWRIKDEQRLGVFITDAGRSAFPRRLRLNGTHRKPMNTDKHGIRASTVNRSAYEGRREKWTFGLVSPGCSPSLGYGDLSTLR